MRAKKILAGILAKLSVASAEKSAARPSRRGYYQPKEEQNCSWLNADWRFIALKKQ